MPEFTSAQKQAIYTRGCDLLVSAAAGSGKTAVLSERVLQMLTDESCPVDIDRFLIVTFTNAAAAEMKERISKKISDMLDRSDIPLYTRNRLLRQLTLVGKASITTIHSFCLDIIRNNFHLIDIDPGFRVSEENETQLLKLQTADKMLETMYGGPDAQIFSRLCLWLGRGKDENLIECILQIYNFIRSFPSPFEWLHNQTQKYNPDNLTDPDSLDWVAELKQSYKIRLESIYNQCKILIDYAHTNGAEFYCPTFENDLYQIKILRKLCEKSWEDLYAAASNFSFAKLASKPKGSDPAVTDYASSQRNEIKDTVKKIITEIVSMAPQIITDGLSRAYPLLLCLEKSIKAFHELYTDKKKASGILDFNDFEHIALSILSDKDNGVAEDLRERYAEIFVDEYQDCNMAQEELFMQICKKQEGLPCNMFMVGDVKQSIYKFRQADPSIFMRKNKSYISGIQQKVVLNKNFRSSSVILDCINNIFSRIMSEYAGEIEYNDEERLYYKEDTAPEITDADKCELLIAQPEDAEGEELPETNIGLEARMVANRIISLKSEGYDYKDIVVLLRGLSTRGSAFEEEFKNRGIPFYMDGGTGYFESLEVRIFISLLKVIDNPLQDIPLAGLLRSPLVGFDENELLQIRLAKKGLFYNAMVKYATDEAEKGRKCRDFLNNLNKWRETSISMPIDEFVDYLMEDTNLYNFALALPNGQQRKANLSLLLERSRSLKNCGFNGLFSYINYIDKLKTHSDSGLAKQLPETSNVVRIMTIHKSKGLEFPVVFLSACNARFNTADYRGSLLLHRKLGIGADFIDGDRKIKYPLISKAAIAERIRIENISEEMRVLYVALTRAKKKLICSGVLKNADEKLDGWQSISGEPSPMPQYFTSNASCYMDWITSCLNDNWDIKILFAIKIQNEYNMPVQKPEQLRKQNSSVNVAGLLEYEYPYITSTKLPTKYTVSELKRRYDFEDVTSVKLYTAPLIKAPKFLKEEEITPAKEGIINHLILKEMPLRRLSEADILHCADTLLNKGLLLENEKPFINIKGIIEFTYSELGARLINSQKVYREMQFNIPVKANEIFPAARLKDETVLVQGIIDCMFEENGKIIIIDFKTDKYLNPDSKKMYKTQLNIYAKAAKALTGMEADEKYLYMLRTREIIRI